jgi:hypothetical protein
MKIVLTFDSFEEFQEQVGRYAAKLKPKKPELIPVEDIAAVVKADEAKKAAKLKQAEPTPEPAPEPVAEPKQVTVTEDYRAEVRHVLHELNKQKNSKTAATDIIKTFGVSRLTDVPLSDLPALMDKAKEALDA